MTATAQIVGNVTKELELRYTPSGKAVLSFGVAVTRTYKENKETSFFDVTCWSDLAEHVAETVQKGDRVVVNGRLQQRSYETQQGEKRSVVELIADEVSPSLKYATAAVTRTERKGPETGEEPFT